MREGVQRFFSSLVSVPSGVEFWIILRIFNKNRKNSDYIPEFCNFPLKIQIVKERKFPDAHRDKFLFVCVESVFGFQVGPNF